jgi:toxin ParE1/3/4
MSRYRLTPRARRDLREIALHIAEDDPAAALRLAEKMLEHFRTLAKMPGMGRARAELGSGLRSFPVSPYLIFYREIETGVEVLRIIHGARDIDETFFA